MLPSPARSSCELGISVGMPGPRDFPVRESFGRLAQRLRPKLSRPSHPAPNVRDDREAPLLSERGTARIMHLILVGVKLYSENRNDATASKLARRAICAWCACACCECAYSCPALEGGTCVANDDFESRAFGQIQRYWLSGQSGHQIRATPMASIENDPERSLEKRCRSRVHGAASDSQAQFAENA